MSVIQVINFTKDYGMNRGAFDVNFDIKNGEVFGFLGPNGAGKSTVIRHLMGFSKSDSGSTLILDKETFANYYKTNKHIGYLPGEVVLPTGITGRQFLRQICFLQKVKNYDRMNYLIQLFKLDTSTLTEKMSFGEKRKLAIVAAFMSDPSILILDEPTSGLDLEMQEAFIAFIKKEKKRGKTVLLSSHIFSEIDATCDRIAIIKHGKIISVFDAHALKNTQQKTFVVKFKTKKQMSDFYIKSTANSPFKILQKTNDNQLIISVDNSMTNQFISALSEYEVIDFLQLKDSLEDYFMKYYKESV